MSRHRSARRSAGGNYKTLQLCRQVERTLHQVLSGECDDDVLRNLMVAGVQPLRGTSQLLVLVQVFDPLSAPPVADILMHLELSRGRLRTAVAEAITRRKAPDLLFQVVSEAEPLRAIEPV